MRLVSLKLVNYKVYKNLNIKFFDGVTAIIGPNESGKSTLIEAILFALYGQKSVPSIQDLVNFESNKSKIGFDFQFKDKSYRISRGLTKSKNGSVSQTHCEFLEIQDDGKTFTLATGPSNVDPLIEQTIGFRYDELIHSNVISQKKLDKISELKPSEWRSLLNEFLNLKGFGSAVADLKEEKNQFTIMLNNEKVKLKQFTQNVLNYWQKFKELCETSKQKLRKNHKLRIKKKIIDINIKFLKIIKEFIEKTNLRKDLQVQKVNQLNILSEKNKNLNTIESLEEENKNLNEELKKYENIDLDGENLFKVKENFEKYKRICQEIENLEKKLDQLKKIEEKCSNLKDMFKSYEDTPQQLEIFRQIEQNYIDLELNSNKRDEFQDKLKYIESLEETNLDLENQLNAIEELLKYKEEFDKSVIIFDKFKARMDQIRSERKEIKDKEYEIQKVKKKCPKDTPDTIEMINITKEKHASLVKGFKSILVKSSKLNLPLILTFTILALVAVFLENFPLTIVFFSLLILILIKILIAYLKNKKYVENLEKLIFLISRIEEIKEGINGAINFLDERYNEIKNLILSLPSFYSKSFSIENDLDQQEYSLNLYFQTLNDNLRLESHKQKKISDEMNENQRYIDNKPEVETNLLKLSEAINQIFAKLVDLFDDFKPKYFIDSINKIDLTIKIDFLKIKRAINLIDGLIKSDMYEFKKLDSEIKTLEEKLEEKPSTLENLKASNAKKRDFFTDINKLVLEMSLRYIQMIGDEASVKSQITLIEPFQNSLEQISIKINKDMNYRNKIQSRVETNNEVIKNKPIVIKEINEINEIVVNIEFDINKIQFPMIPNEIVDKFDEENPELCKSQLENIIHALEEDKNNLNGQITELNNKRSEIKKYLLEKESLNDEYFQSKSDIANLEWDIDVYVMSINSIEQVNREIWDMQMPYITSYIRQFLPKITMGRYRVLNIQQSESRRKKRYEFKVLEENSQTFIDKELLSGGTEDQVLLAIRVAFAMSLLPQSKGDYPRFLFLDESFASSDHDRRMEILNWLMTDLSTVFSQIIIISHQQQIIENIPYHYKLVHGKITEKVTP
ncbi:MAG: hypothetical protein EU533_00015 [Promethearchaeota archaeon]|nr:MAG: hypothetical protein EU533_00015 [Candidatus Lokiarchaeota archaeon]